MKAKVVAVMSAADKYGGIERELKIREIFASKRDWQITFVRANSLFNPDLIKDADLLMVSRGNGADPVDLFSRNAGIADMVSRGEELWTDRNVKAIIDNVEKRGMGLMALNSTIVCGRRDFTDFLDAEPIEAKELEPVWGTHINKEHPITTGVGKFMIALDEQYAAVIKSSSTVSLFETTSIHEKRQALSGWSLERGKGRIACLLPGSTAHAYEAPEYQNIFWRAAHWAMKRDIGEYPRADNRYYE